jgi:hypothetical protein
MGHFSTLESRREGSRPNSPLLAGLGCYPVTGAVISHEPGFREMDEKAPENHSARISVVCHRPTGRPSIAICVIPEHKFSAVNRSGKNTCYLVSIPVQQGWR